MTSSSFVHTADAPWETVGEGVRRQILGHGPDLMLVRVEFRKGAIGAIHHHPHRQVTYVVRGSFDAEVGGQKQRLAAGDCFFVTAEVPHGVIALEEGTLIDVFTPAREDFLRGTAPPRATE